MANVKFGNQELSALGFSLQGMSGREMAGWSAEKTAALFRDLSIDLSARHSLDTKTTLAGTLSADQDVWANFNRAGLEARLDALKVALDPEVQGFQKLWITGDATNPNRYRWARFEAMVYDEAFPIFKVPMQKIGLSFENLEPFWRTPATQLVKTTTPFLIPNTGSRGTRPKIQLTFGSALSGASVANLLKIGDLQLSWKGVDIAANDLVRIDAEEGTVRRAPLVPPVSAPVLTTNVVTDPAFESGLTTGYSVYSSATSIAAVAAAARRGSFGLRVTKSSGGAAIGGVVRAFTVPAAGLYNVSVYVKGVVGHTYALYVEPVGDVQTFVATGAYQRVSLVSNAPATTLTVYVWDYAMASGQTFDIDDIQITAGPTLWDYFDGGMAYVSRWSGATNGSSSLLFNYEEDVVRGYLYSGQDGDSMPLVPAGGSWVMNKHANISSIQIDYDLLTK